MFTRRKASHCLGIPHPLKVQDRTPRLPTKIQVWRVLFPMIHSTRMRWKRQSPRRVSPLQKKFRKAAQEGLMPGEHLAITEAGEPGTVVTQSDAPSETTSAFPEEPASPSDQAENNTRHPDPASENRLRIWNGTCEFPLVEGEADALRAQLMPHIPGNVKVNIHTATVGTPDYGSGYQYLRDKKTGLAMDFTRSKWALGRALKTALKKYRHRLENLSGHSQKAFHRFRDD